MIMSEMLEVDTMSTLESNIALLTTIPEEFQEQIHTLLVSNFCTDNPFKPISEKEILDELAEGRACYQQGKYKDFDCAVDEVEEKYGL